MTSTHVADTHETVATAGVRANARLTAATGLVLLALIVVEAVTVVLKPLNVLPVHLAVGLAMVPLVALKFGSTGWRSAKYYLGFDAYRQKGPPPLAMRLMGPVVILLTVAILASGVLLLVGPASIHSGVLTVHKFVFYPWLLAIVVHLAAHLGDAVRLVSRDLLRRLGDVLPGTRYRFAAVVACALVGAVLALTLTGHGTDYLQSFHPGR